MNSTMRTELAPSAAIMNHLPPLRHIATLCVALACAYAYTPTHAQVEPAVRAVTAAAPVTRDCTESFTPDRVVVAGGISAETISPKDGAARIDKITGALRTYVGQHGGNLTLLDRLRAARNPEGSRDGAQSMPFLQLQRFEADFPVAVDVDTVLERMLQLGMDRYGRNIQVADYSSRQYQMLTSYRISNFDDKIVALRNRCVESAVGTKCTATSCVANGWYATAQFGNHTTEQGEQSSRHIAFSPAGSIQSSSSLQGMRLTSTRAVPVTVTVVAHGAR